MSTYAESVDDEIVRRAADGDRDAQRQIYEVFCNRVYRIVQRIVGEADASDVVQEAFLHLFAKLPSFRREAAFSTWMHRLVVNEALQFLRRRSRQMIDTKSLMEHDVAQIDRTQWQRDAAESLAKAMDRIDPELRLIFQLKEVDELSYAQIGELVGIPEGTVGSRLNRARTQLKDLLEKLGWGS